MSFEIAIQVKNLSKCYFIYDKPHDRLKQFVFPRIQRLAGHQANRYYREFWALKNISFEVKKGETVGILGRNGSGKSTLLQIIAGTLAPTSGSTTTFGRIAALLELGSGFSPDFTGRENIYVNGTILGLTKEEIDNRFDDIVRFADIGDFLDQPIKTYSSGMVVRLAFAVQACISPQTLIVDEALSVGDEKFQRKCFDHIEHLREEGCSILLVTHSTPTVEKFCQRAILLNEGILHGIGPAKEIVDQYHALLYSDEKAYTIYINKILKENLKSNCESNHNSKNIINDTETLITRATITGWTLLNSSGKPSEHFETGEIIKVQFFVDIFCHISEIQAGILIRTVEGVSVFGTSTLYHKKNFFNAQPGSRLRFDFELHANLCVGSYFITLAIAEAISHGDMLYLDRKTDVIVFKIYQHRLLGSGIAMLNTHVSVTDMGAVA